MSKKFMSVQFPRGALLPQDVTRDGAACKVGPGEVVEVTEAYGWHVISDKFAEPVQADKPSRKKADKGASEGSLSKKESDDAGAGSGDGSRDEEAEGSDEGAGEGQP